MRIVCQEHVVTVSRLGDAVLFLCGYSRQQSIPLFFSVKPTRELMSLTLAVKVHFLQLEYAPICGLLDMFYDRNCLRYDIASEQ